MKWIYCIKPKHKAALILSLVFVMILGKSMFSKKSISELGTSFSSVYEDRLVVESYIFKISDILYRKKIITDSEITGSKNSTALNKLKIYNQEINILLTDYEKTKLTEKEVLHFSTLKASILKLNELEQKFYLNEANFSSLENEKLLEDEFQSASKSLALLSQIQVSEGKNLSEKSMKSIAGFTLISQFEMGLLILLGLIIQALVLSSKNIIAKTPQNHSLN